MNYTKGVLVKRILWSAGKVIFGLSPKPFFRFRNFILRLYGAKIGSNVRIYPSAEIFFPWNFQCDNNVLVSWNVKLYTLGKIHIKENVIISQFSHLCAGSHDIRFSNLPLITQPIVINSHVWICANTFIGPGVTINSHSIIGAGVVVMNDVKEGSTIRAATPEIT